VVAHRRYEKQKEWVMSKIVAGLFRTQADCDAAKADLNAAGIAPANIALLGRSDAAMDGFARRLGTLGIPEEDAFAYKEGIAKGYGLLTIKTTAEQSGRAADILLRHHPVGMKQSIEGPASAATQTAGEKRSAFDGLKKDFVASEEIKVPIMAERLDVSKRFVDRGGLRIYNRVVERPVQATVNLREEHVKVERRATDQPVSDSAWDSFVAEDVEIMEHGEEAVARKSARVVEELLVDRQVGEHEETIRDTVRRTELNVERTQPRARAAAKNENAVGPKTSLKPQQTADGKLAVPVIEEALRVDKRNVDRGAVHISERVVERPAEAKVMLRDEHVQVTRRTVDQPVAGAEWDSAEETIEMTERAEEAVIGKSSHIVEEVIIKKVVDPRDEVVRDTVRKTEVRVEPFNQREFAMFESDFRTDFDKKYANAGLKYSAVAPAYRFGYERGRHQSWLGKEWMAAEPDFRRDWQKANPETAWEKIKDSIRYGWDKARGRQKQ